MHRPVRGVTFGSCINVSNYSLIWKYIFSALVENYLDQITTSLQVIQYTKFFKTNHNALCKDQRARPLTGPAQIIRTVHEFKNIFSNEGFVSLMALRVVCGALLSWVSVHRDELEEEGNGSSPFEGLDSHFGLVFLSFSSLFSIIKNVHYIEIVEICSHIKNYICRISFEMFS